MPEFQTLGMITSIKNQNTGMRPQAERSSIQATFEMGRTRNQPMSPWFENSGSDSNTHLMWTCWFIHTLPYSSQLNWSWHLNSIRLLRNRFKPQTKQKNCNHPSQSYNIESSRSILVGIQLALRPAWDSHTSAPCLEITSISLSLRPLQSLKSHSGNACLNHVFFLGLLHGPLPVWWLTPMMLTKGRKFTPSSSKWRKA